MKHTKDDRAMSARQTSAATQSTRDQHTQRDPRNTNSATKERVREVADQVMREHRPALDWLADK